MEMNISNETVNASTICFDATETAYNFSSYWSPLYDHTFLRCYVHFLISSLPAAIFMYALILLCLVINGTLIYTIATDRDKRDNIFNQIIVCEAVVNLVCTVCDDPYYNVLTVFGYWPFGQAPCMLFSILDNALNTLVIVHMLALSWTRFVSVFMPNTYKTHWLSRHPFVGSALAWLFSLSVYSVVDFFFLLQVQDQYFQCLPLYTPSYLLGIVQFCMILLPLLAVIGLTVPVMCVIRQRKKKMRGGAAKNKTITITTAVAAAASAFRQREESIVVASRNQPPQQATKKSLNCLSRISAEQKLSLIIGLFIVQWAPMVSVWFSNSFCNCVPFIVLEVSNLISYLTTLTDALLVLLLNTQFNKMK